MKLGKLVGRHQNLSKAFVDIEISALTSDSRKVQRGTLFAALPGSRLNGAKFIPQAIERGASALMVAEGEAQRLEGQIPHTLPLIESAHLRRELALMAARLIPEQPQNISAITGTNGKTSVASFLRQIWHELGYQAANLGTTGVITHEKSRPLSHTTPEPVELHGLIADLTKDGITHLAIEASSHGLEQRRLDGLRLQAGAFTNISRDHLDYHGTFENYFSQKLYLFSELLPADGAVVLDPDAAGAPHIIEIAEKRGMQLFTVGRRGQMLGLKGVRRDGFAQHLTVTGQGEERHIRLPLVGDFQVSNALVAAGLAIASGGKLHTCLLALEHLLGAKGRLEHVGESLLGAPIFIDYAHTPDALSNALGALRPYAEGRLVVVFGCGGDRDRGKRPQMGQVAHEVSDITIVTDDNPRSEDPARIRAEILLALPDALEIADRQEAISQAIEMLREGDVLLIAGKGHEIGQIVADQVLPFSDHQAVQYALGKGDR